MTVVEVRDSDVPIIKRKAGEAGKGVRASSDDGDCATEPASSLRLGGSQSIMGGCQKGIRPRVQCRKVMRMGKPQ